MQTENKNQSDQLKPTAFKKSVTGLVMVSLVLSTITPALLFPVGPVVAANKTLPSPAQPPAVSQAAPVDLGENALNPANAAVKPKNQVKVLDETVDKTGKEGNTLTDAFKKAVEVISETFNLRDWNWEGMKDAVYVASKEALNYLLNTFAYDVATWLASGGKGQQPMFFTEGWGEYLTNVLDEAGGVFLESMGKDWAGFNLCNPSSFSLKVSIGLGIAEMQRPRKPACTITQMVNNWDQMISEGNILDNIELMFDPNNNDFGIAVGIFGRYAQYQSDSEKYATQTRTEGQGAKSVGGKISDKILTPAFLVRDEAREMLAQGLVADKEVDYGDIFMNAVSNFINTLAGKLLDRLFKEGLAALRGSDKDNQDKDNSDLFDLMRTGENLGRTIYDLLTNRDDELYTGQTGTTLFVGKQASQERYSGLLRAGVKESGPYDVLTKFVVCQNPANPGVDECVIDQKFRSAIQKQMTLKQAISEGLINGDAPFGYQAATIKEGIPIRTILILRAHRIVPVGWELAARVANEFEPSKTYTLNDLIAKYNELGGTYKGLVDPNWVLEAPLHYCKAQGFGAKVTSDKIVAGTDENKDGDYDDITDMPPGRTVAREQYCADFQTCIKKSSNGGCLYYGYCTEEKPIWDLQGKDCKPQFNTCLTFQRPDGKVVSYLENTLNYNNCSQANAGCQWYCNQFNPISNVWSCVAETDKVLKTCSQTEVDASGGVGCITEAECEMDLGDTFCIATVPGVRLTISEPCGAMSKWWNGSKCVIDTTCTIPKGGVYCQQTGCEAEQNLLSNPSFETASTTFNETAPALNWYGNRDYFKQVGSALDYIYSGRSSLRFYNAGTNISEEVTSGPLSLADGQAYSVTGYVFNNLNTGQITISTMGAEEEKSTVVPVESKQRWHQFSFDFIADTGPLRIKIGIMDPNNRQVSGSAWFDALRLSKSCITNPVTMTMIGDVEKAESKINFDRDVRTCPAEAAGCTEFISLLPNNGVNLIRNGSFEDWLDGVPFPNGWVKGEQWHNLNQIIRYSPGVIGNYALQIKNGPVAGHYRDFSTLPIAGLKPNTTYRVSFYAKTDDPAPDQANWYAEFLSKHDPLNYCSEKTNQTCVLDSDCVTLDAGEKCIRDYDHIFLDDLVDGMFIKKLSNQWQRFVSNPVTVRSAGRDFVLSINNGSTNASSIIVDGIQIEEVDSRNPVSSEYRDYGLTNLYNIKKAPASFACYGYTKTRPSPYVLKGVNYQQCHGNNLVWRKFCNGGSDNGKACGVSSDCADGAVCYADSCDPTGNECCHEIDPPACADYAPYCFEDEVGCQLFTPVGVSSAAVKLPAVAQLTDYCPAECVGYEAFYQSATFLERQQSLEYFIPKTARSCPAAAVGCDEFTNLDEVAKGGEGREYYQYLRLCKKPTDTAANCRPFYAWQGSDEAGYQLKSYLLSADAQNVPVDAITDFSLLPDAWCDDKTITNGLPACCNGPEDISSNPFCKELIGSDGQISYRIYLNTVSCSDSCHPYRKTVYGGNTANNQTNCLETSGTWDSSLLACIYNAIPREGLSCAAANAGCREYRGNTAGNVFVAFSDNFESGTTVNWINGSISSEALTVGGHSVRSANPTGGLKTLWDDLGAVCTKNTGYDPAKGTCSKTGGLCEFELGQQYCGVLGNLVPGRMYTVSFWAKTPGNNQNLTLTLETENQTDQVLGQVAANGEWSYYLIGPVGYDQTQGLNLSSSFVFSSTADFYLDNLVIKEVNNFVYAIKGSWRTPQSCDINPFLAEPISAPQFMLGCKEYRDSNNNRHYLKSFTNLCREEAVGCEAMIDTFNSFSPFEIKAPFEDKYSAVTVPEDRLSYIVNRPNVRCNAQYQGCQAFGAPTLAYNELSQPQVTGFSQVYFINDPDFYNTILCARGENGCAEYQSASGYSYFKDPGVQACEWKLIPNTNKSAWFRTDIPSQTPNCPMLVAPVGEPHPDGTKGFAGLCPADQNTCTLFVDPVSEISKNLIFNSDFSADVDGNNIPDGWNLEVIGNVADPDNLYQRLPLSHDTLYTYSITADITQIPDPLSVFLFDCPDLQTFDNSFDIQDENDNKIPLDSINQDSREIPGLGNVRSYSARFYVPRDMTCSLKVSFTDTANPRSSVYEKIKKLAIRKTGQYYVLANTADQLTCNGVVNPANGCVLFNDRSAVNYHLGENDISYLSFDADVSGLDAKGQAINNGLAVNDLGSFSGDSNAVLKVVPDRTCATWLACAGSVSETDEKNAEKKYCTDLGLCDQADDDGNCTNFVVSAQGAARQTYFDREQMKNYSGFSSPGLAFESDVASLSGNFLPSEMRQVGGITYSPSTNFEIVSAGDFRPYGWRLECPLLTDPPVKNFFLSEWKSDYARVITNPVSAQQEGLPANAPEGLAFAKVTGPYVISSENIDVNGGTEYTISAYINTEKLIKGQTRIVLEQYDAVGDYISDIGYGANELNNLKIGPSQKWTFGISTFTTDAEAASVKILLMNQNRTDSAVRKTNACNNRQEFIHDILGSSYFDDIKIKPSLEVSRDFFDLSVFVPPACRVFPEADSLSCDYYSDKGYHFRGWLGYCLLADPANSAQCLLWYPVELIQGGYISEEPAVAQRPLYYCLGAKESHFRYRQCLFEEGEMCASMRRPSSDKTPKSRTFTWEVPGDWRIQRWQIEEVKVGSSVSDCNASDQCGVTFGLFTMIPSPNIPNNYSGSSISLDLIYDADGQLNSVKFEVLGPDCLCGDADIMLQVASPWCQYVSQTITPYGQNKAWWERVSNNSGQLFAVPGTGYTNLFDYPPFGALVPPYPVDNPPSWDLREINSIWFSPLRVEEPSKSSFNDPYQARAGLPYGCSQLSEVFGLDSCKLPQLNRATSSSVVINKDTVLRDNRNLELAQQSLMRIFAKSYETYQFQGDGVCKTSDGRSYGEECACPESTCGLEAQVKFSTCKNTGAACEASQIDCMNLLAIAEVIGAVVNEIVAGSSSPDMGSLIALILSKIILQFITSCSPEPCSESDPCIEGQGECIPFIQYLLHFYGIADDEPNAVGIVFNYLFGPILAFFTGQDTASAGDLTQVIEDTYNNSDMLEDVLEGNPLVAIGSMLGEELAGILGNYCSLTSFRCKVNENSDPESSNIGKRCCFFSKCVDKEEITYRCMGGPNKGMICDPSPDNCPTGSTCEIRTDGESYLPVSENDIYLPVAAKPWNPPVNLCINNIRPEYICNSGINRNGACLSDTDCPSLIGRCIQKSDDTVVCRDVNGYESTNAGCYYVENAGNNLMTECRVNPAGSCVLKSNRTTPVPALPADFCAVAPAVTSVKVNNSQNADLIVLGGDMTLLTFTVRIDPQQLPLTGYTIDWGDNKKTSLSGQSLLSREDPNQPFQASHVYSYWELLAANSQEQVKCRAGAGECCVADADGNNYCAVLPRVQIIDNWNWCNNGDGSSGYYGANCVQIYDNPDVPDAAANAWRAYNGEVRVYP